MKDVSDSGDSPPAAEDLQSLFGAAVAAHQSGSFDEAERLYLRILAERPDNVNLICNLGLLYRQTGRHAEALERLWKVSEVAPDNFGVILNIGAVHEDLGDLAAAETAFRKAAALDPDDPRGLNNLGKVLFNRGKRQEALTFLQRAVMLYPEYSLAQNNLGVLLNSLGDNEAALAAFTKALAVDPDNPSTLYNMAGALSLAGNLDAAAEYYRKTLAVDSGNECARHMLAASSGESTDKAPAAYVVDTFDRYSGHFDRQLTESLSYEVPAMLAQAVREIAETGPFARCLDLGCGTGLSGLAFRDMAGTLVGVDLSSGMLERAMEKNIYDAVHQADIATFLERDNHAYDLFVATDVFVYIGDLQPVFQAVRKRAGKGAYLVFSIETVEEGPDYELRVSGRYAQSAAYIRRLAERNGFTEIHCAPCNIRKEQGQWITGHLFLLQATA